MAAANDEQMDTVAMARAIGEHTRENNELGLRAAVDEFTGPRKLPQPGQKVQMGPVGAGSFHPTLALDPNTVMLLKNGGTNGEPLYDEDTKVFLAPVATAFSAAYLGLQDIDKAKRQAEKDPSRTAANVLLQVAAFAERHQAKITAKFDSVLKTLDAQISSREAMLTAPLESAANSNLVASEVRAHVKAMSGQDRMKFINERRAAGDVKTLQMILGGPSFLSGMSDSERALHTRMFHEAQNPVVSKQLKAMQAARQMIETRAPLVFGEVTRAMGADWKKISRLREAHSAAEQAFILRDHTVDVTT